MNEQVAQVRARGYTVEQVKADGVQVIGRFNGISRKGWLMRGYDFVNHGALAQPEVFGCGEAGIFRREIWDQSCVSEVDREHHARQKALLDSIPESSRMPVFAAREMMREKTAESKALVQELFALIGRRALEGETPFDFSRGTSTGALRGWIGNDSFHLTMEIRPDEFAVWIEISHTFAVVASHLVVPGEIVGLHRGEGYTGVYFSLERCERHSNLFSLLDAVAPAILKTMALARAKVEEKRQKMN